MDRSATQAPTARSGVALRGWRRQLRQLLGNRLLVIGIVIMLPICVMALAAPHLTPYDPVDIDTSQKLLPMSAAHPFGTDELGRDVLTRVIHGSRISLRVGGLATLFAALAGGVLGLLAGYYRVADQLISRVVDGVVMFPGLVLGIMLMAALGPAEFNVVIAFTIINAPRIVRVVRASVLEVKEMDYIDAAARGRHPQPAHPGGAHSAERVRPGRGAGVAGIRRRDPGRGGTELPRHRHAAAGAGAGATSSAMPGSSCARRRG